MRSMYSERMHGCYDPSIASLKRDVLARLMRARSEGIKAGQIVEASGDSLNIYIIYDMMNAETFAEEKWLEMDSALKCLGY